MTNSSLEFDLSEITFPVTISGQSYLLVEANSETGTQFKVNTLKGLTLDQREDGSKKINGLENIAGNEAYLVSRCLFKIDDAGRRHAVDLATVKGWPNRIVKSLYEKSREISGLKEVDDAKAEAKN
jgi:hypothetical protein